MSYQPYPGQQPDPYAPVGGPVVQQPGAPFAPSAPGKRRTGLFVLGLVVLVAGVLGGLALIGSASNAEQDAVEGLARAPIGCTTTLEFDSTGTYTIYVETSGQTADVRGDCPGNDADYSRDADDLPDVDVAIANEDGDEIDTARASGTSYDNSGFVGTSIRSVDIEDAGTYLLTVTSDDDEFAIAVGKNPSDAGGSAKTGGWIALGAGIVVGALLIALGLKRKPATGGPSTGTPAAYDQAPQAYAQQYPPTQPQPYTPPQQYPPAQQYPPTQPQPYTPPQQYPPTQPYPPQQPPAPPGGGGWPAPPNS